MHLGEVAERDLTSHAPARGPPATQGPFAAYQVLVTVLMTVTSAPMIAFVYFGLTLPLHVTQWHFLALFFLFINLSISLPASVVAWTEPDPEPENF